MEAVTAKPKPTRETREKKPKKGKGKGGKKRTPSERKVLVARIEELCGLLVKWRDGYQCVQCGTRERPTKGHVIPTAAKGVSYDLLNQHCQCAPQNLQHRYRWDLYQDWFIGEFGNDAWEYLKAHRERMWSVVELREMKERYETLWNNRPSMFARQDLFRMGYYGDYGLQMVI